MRTPAEADTATAALNNKNNNFFIKFKNLVNNNMELKHYNNLNSSHFINSMTSVIVATEMVNLNSWFKAFLLQIYIISHI